MWVIYFEGTKTRIMGVPDRFKKRWAGHVLPDHAAEMRARHLAESGDSLCPARVPTFL